MHKNITHLPVWSPSIAGSTLTIVVSCDVLVTVLGFFLGADGTIGGNALGDCDSGPAVRCGSAVVGFFCGQHRMVGVIRGSPSKTPMVPHAFKDFILFQGAGC